MSIIPKIPDGLEQRAQITSQVFGGIQPPFEAFFIHSILYTADCSLRAFSRYDEIRASGGKPQLLIGALQEAIGHAGALSRYFNPPQPRNEKGVKRPRFHQLVKDRGEKLSNAFNVTETSPLNGRNLRDVWEHFEERLDKYLLEVTDGVFFPECVVGNIDDAENIIGHYLKKLDPQSETLILLDTHYHFGPIRTEVQRIYDAALDADRNGSRLPPIPIEFVELPS